MRCIHHRYSMINMHTINWFECRIMELPKMNKSYMAGLLRMSQEMWDDCFTQIYIMLKAEEIIRKVMNTSTQNSQYDDAERHMSCNV
jgi:hypothetical protein